jgi:hypothetical protein
MVDFHSHSTASDGTLAPTQLVELASQRGLVALALTDHDTVAGLDEARLACQERHLKFIPGIELEIAFEHGEFHLLGLGLRQWKTGWVEGLAELQRLRSERNHRIFSKMREAGIRGDYSEIERLAQGGQVGRPHFARFLVERGKVNSVQEAFTHFLGKGQLFYVARAGLDLEAAIRMIHEAGALAVVAHPKTLRVSQTVLETLLASAKDKGLDGLEAWHPGAEPRVARKLEALALKLRLKVSAGSDFHGDIRPERNLGLTSGGLPIEDSFLEKLFPEGADSFQ